MYINKDQSYYCVRFFKTKKEQILKVNLSREEAVKFCLAHPSKKYKGEILSFVGWKKK